MDSAGEPHVLDFGLARWRPGAEAFGPELSRLTRTEGFVGTPAYAAPAIVAGSKVPPAEDADLSARSGAIFSGPTDPIPFPAFESSRRAMK